RPSSSRTPTITTTPHRHPPTRHLRASNKPGAIHSFSRHESVQPEAGRATYPTLSRCAGAVELAVVLWSRGAVPGARMASKTAAAAVRSANLIVACLLPLTVASLA